MQALLETVVSEREARAEEHAAFQKALVNVNGIHEKNQEFVLKLIRANKHSDSAL